MNNPSGETANRDYDKAARCGEPSYVWREGQERRLQMILEATKGTERNTILENGCGVGMYVEHLAPHFRKVIGLEYDYIRASEAHEANVQFRTHRSLTPPVRICLSRRGRLMLS